MLTYFCLLPKIYKYIKRQLNFLLFILFACFIYNFFPKIFLCDKLIYILLQRLVTLICYTCPHNKILYNSRCYQSWSKICNWIIFNDRYIFIFISSFFQWLDWKLWREWLSFQCARRSDQIYDVLLWRFDPSRRSTDQQWKGICGHW